MTPRFNYTPGFTHIELITAIGIIAVLAGLLLPAFFRAREAAHGATCLSNLKQVGLAVHTYLQDWDDTFPMSRFPDATHHLTGCLNPSLSDPEDGLHGTSLNWKRALAPYVRNRAVFECPSNAYAWRTGGFNNAPGDETNPFYPRSDWLPSSYAYNGSFFHEAVPACWYGELWERPRYIAEIEAPAGLILLVESRYSYPDLGGWWIPARGPAGGEEGPFQSHNGACTWLFADQHVKRLKPAAICAGLMLTDRYVDRSAGCEHLDQVAGEYR